MSKTIERTFTTSTVVASKVTVVKGKLVPAVLEPLDMDGKVSIADATKAIMKKYGKLGNYAIMSITYHDTLRSMDVDKFVADSKVISVTDVLAEGFEAAEPEGEETNSDAGQEG